MSKRIILTIIALFCSFVLYGQSQCDILLDAARKYKNKGEYEKAVENYDRLEKKCPNYFTETVRGERSYCKKKLGNQNKPAPQKPSNQTVSSNQQSSSQTISTPQSVEDQLKTVKVSFESGKATPILENERVLIKELQDNDSLGLEIEVPWCRNLYSKRLIENRIQNIIDYFVASGIEEKRILSSITLVDVEDDYHFLVDYPSSEKDKDSRISDHITLINVEEGYNACDSAWLKIGEMLKVGDGFILPLSKALSKTKILFDFGKDSPIIYDHGNLAATVRILKNNKTLKLVVEGYAPDAPNEHDQWELAQRRANNVREIFTLLGLSSEQIEISPMTVNDLQNRQNLTDPNLKEHRAVIFRIINREETQKQSNEEPLSEGDLADIRELSEALSNVKIKFDYDKDIPKIDDFRDNLDRVVAVLRKNRTLKLIVELHTDGSDSEEHDRELALRRAHKIRDLFIGNGISSDQIDKVVLSDNHRAIVFRILKR